MSKSVVCKNENLSYIAYNLEKKIFHHGSLVKGMTVTTGQPELESFDTEEEMLTRLKELAGEELFAELTKKAEEPVIPSQILEGGEGLNEKGEGEEETPKKEEEKPKAKKTTKKK